MYYAVFFILMWYSYSIKNLREKALLPENERNMLKDRLGNGPHKITEHKEALQWKNRFLQMRLS